MSLAQTRRKSCTKVHESHEKYLKHSCMCAVGGRGARISSAKQLAFHADDEGIVMQAQVWSDYRDQAVFPVKVQVLYVCLHLHT